MAKKIKDFLNDICTTAGIESTEMEAIKGASSLDEVELTDEFVEKFQEGILTRESAKVDEDLKKHFRTSHWAEFAGLIDQRINKINPLLSAEQVITIKEIENTPDKLEKAIEYVNATIIKAREDKPGDSAELEKKITTLESDKIKLQETHQEIIDGMTETHTKEIEGKDNRFIDYKLDNVIRDEILGRQLIDNIPGGKKFLADSLIRKVKELPDKIPTLLDTGSVEFHKRSDPTEKFFGKNRKEPSLSQVLDDETDLKDFIKNSPGRPTPGNSTPLPVDVPAAGETLAAKNARLAKENIQTQLAR